MLRAAVIGCGAAGASDGAAHPDVGIATHEGAYRACPDTELVALCDTDPARAGYTDAAAMLDAEAPEIVSVATPDGTHASLVETCLRAPSVRAVLAEKPLALDVREAEALVAHARERKIVLAVNYTRRYLPAFQRLREQDLGDLQHVSGVYVKGLAHNGSHWLDLLRMLAGEPVSVRGCDRLHEPGDDPTLDAELTLPRGASARLAGLDANAFTAFEMELTYTRGRVRIAEAGHMIETWDVGDDVRHPGYRALRPSTRKTGALRDGTLHAVTDVVRAVRTGGEPACTGEDAVAALELVAAIRESALRSRS